MAASGTKPAPRRGSGAGGGAAAATAVSYVKDRRVSEPSRRDPIHRSRSVSAVSRNPETSGPPLPPRPSSSSSSSDMPGFSKTCDNPLFACSSSGSPERCGPTRGRASRRSSASSSRPGVGRRVRSLSRVYFEDLEKDELKLEDLQATEIKQAWKSRHPVDYAWDAMSPPMSHWEHENLTNSGSGEEITSHLRKNPAITTHSIDIPLELVNSDGTELIRMQYASKLEQSEERARKLREDLDLEVQHGQELVRILKEIIPCSNYSGTRRYRPRREASIERIKLSQVLTEEALNYFDECVSISTFEGSDFSSLEEPPPSSSAGVPSLVNRRIFSSEDVNISHFSRSHLEEIDNQLQFSPTNIGSELEGSSSCITVRDHSVFHGSNEDATTHKQWVGNGNGNDQASCIQESIGAGTCGISYYIKKFEKEAKKDRIELSSRTSYDPDDYGGNFNSGLHLDKLIYRNRIEAGGLMICEIRIF